jgi:hypothetical protein
MNASKKRQLQVGDACRVLAGRRSASTLTTVLKTAATVVATSLSRCITSSSLVSHSDEPFHLKTQLDNSLGPRLCSLASACKEPTDV